MCILEFKGSTVNRINFIHRHGVEGLPFGHKPHSGSPGNGERPWIYSRHARECCVHTYSSGPGRGYEHREDMIKIPAHITGREEARTETEGIISMLDALSSE